MDLLLRDLQKCKTENYCHFEWETKQLRKIFYIIINTVEI